MFKRTYATIYTVRPNKKTAGVKHAINLTFNGKLTGNPKNQAKLLKTLCTIHRVNPDAIIVEKVTIISVKFALFDIIGEKFKALFRKAEGEAVR